MTSIQERLQLKREPLDKWSVREQLCLASAVCRSGDQNWMSVSRALKPFGEPNRPSDWFHQKNCAAQYGMLLGNVETPKRKNKKSNVDSGGETPAESILKRLVAERQAELQKLLSEEKTEYQKLQADMVLLQSGKVSEEQLDKWCQEIEQEETQKEQESILHSQWLKERELRKQEIEKVWRPTKPIVGHKRKSSDPLDNLIEQEQMDEIALQQQQPHHQIYPQTPEPMKQALSPLLTSLLKSPSQVPNTPILHTAITNRPLPNTSTNPMIASLLNSSPTVTVSPSLQQLVSSAIGQETQEIIGQMQPPQQQQQPPIIPNGILDDENLPNIKIDDLANSILVQDGPLPEIKKEEVDDIISEIIENAHDIVTDPEQHLELDGNGDINLGLDDFDDDDEADLQDIGQPKTETKDDEKNEEKIVSSPPIVDPFEFREDPVIPLTPSVKVSNINKQDQKQYVPQYQQQTYTESDISESKEIDNMETDNKVEETQNVEVDEKNSSSDTTNQTHSTEDTKQDLPEEIVVKEEPAPVPGSVEIVEVVVTDDDEEIEKVENKCEVDTSKVDNIEEIKIPKEEIEEKVKIEIEANIVTDSKEIESTATIEESSETSDTTAEVKKEVEQDTVPKTEITDEIYDEANIEVKFDKTVKAKRDYSRTKKKDEKAFNILLAIEKAQLEDPDSTMEDNLSDNPPDQDKKDLKHKIKIENDRSNSPWTEEEEGAAKGSKRRYSTPVTPTDSIPNSPASSSAICDDDREYKNWKKSVMLVYNRLATNKYASLFLKPINDDQAPGYSATIYRPMDLLTIKKNIENGTIRSTLEFKRDTMLMFTNAIMYNRTNSLVYNMALKMQQECIEPIEILMMAGSSNDFSLRRETRTSDIGTKRKRTFTDEILLKSTAKKRKED
ncbi:bromodomain-containing protein 8 isoform X1 [Diorhabda sublineata]|uniref:bromodomain-containing protein 8 isoform X1 n=1 Tax=Diorhabda sublineata TaxID=1163346 RepID=UPI0024E0DA49|nr:bromodomain-containing protein 8 isoform X1 [Diorhabda sublineata]